MFKLTWYFHTNNTFLTLFQAGGLFSPPPTSIRHNFFLVIADKLKFSIAFQLLIRKILSKYFSKNIAIMELWHHFERLCTVFQLVYICCDCNRVCMFIVINVFHIWLVLVYFRNYIFILRTSSLSILPLWCHNDITYFKIQDFTKGMNVMRLENLFYCK